jgi:3-oxoacyl-[acyl-carrier protein] reductase
MRLKGANALGMAIAAGMAMEGANVCIADVNIDKAEASAEEVRKSGVKASAIKLDVSNQDEVINAFGSFIKDFGTLDILVNNAGITRDTLLIRMKEEDWDSVMNINLKGTFLCSREAVRIMSKQRAGKIINISSIVAFIGNPGQANYSSSKAAVIGLTKTIAREYAGRGIRVNAVAPGFIQTPMTDDLSDKVKDEMKQAIPLANFGTTGDVTNAVIFLASKESDYITGQVLHVNGGMYM